MDNFEKYSSRTKRRKIKANVKSILKDLEDVSDENEDCDFPQCSAQAADNFSEAVLVEDNSNIDEGQDREETLTGSQGDLGTVVCEIEEYDSPVDDGNDSENCSDDDLRDIPDPIHLREKLAAWAVQFGISHSALAQLLQILQSCNLDVPKDPRTLLMTPKYTDIRETATGSYYHFGVANVIMSKLTAFPPLDTETLTLHINIDGLPLFGSSLTNLWPILGMIKEFPDNSPFVIGVYCGSAKPSSLNEYLFHFIKEMNGVLQNGIEHNFRKFNVKLDAFICDAPARAFIKCIKGHSGYHSCERCTQRGVYNGKMTFPEFNAPLRTDVAFDEMRDNDHHTDTSPLKELGVGFVSQFVLDYMHLVCLGIVRKMIFLWMKGPQKSEGRLSATLLSVISENLGVLRERLPREFARKPRALSEYKMWKATEFRQFLLYTGPVVLYGKLPHQLYKTFMLLSISIRILTSESLCSLYCDYAEKLLVHFVKNFASIYGTNEIVYNMHSVTHIVQDVRRYGALDNISCFPYENLLYQLKKMVRRPQNPIAQIMRRISEKENMQTISSDIGSCDGKGFHRKPHLSGPTPVQYRSCRQYKQYRGDSIFISCSSGDNCFDVNDRVVLVRNILHSPSAETFIVYQEFTKTSSFFDYPLNSLCLGIRACSKIDDKLLVGKLHDFVKKLVLLPYKQHFVALPLLHHKNYLAIMTRFAVVEFAAEDKAVAIICNSWFVGDEEEYCLWPNVNATRLAKIEQEPCTTWKKLKIRVLGKAGTFTRAMEKLKLSEETSDLNTDVEELSRKRRRIQNPRFLDDSDSDIEESESRPATCRSGTSSTGIDEPLPQVPPSLLEINTEARHREPVVLAPSPPRASQQVPSSPRPSTSRDTTSEFLDQVSDTSVATPSSSDRTYLVGEKLQRKQLELTLQMMENQKVQSAMLQAILRKINCSNLDAAVLPEGINFPLESIEEMEEIDTRLIDPAVRGGLTSVLAEIGGRTVDEFVRRTMKFSITNRLAIGLNMCGRNGKKAFGPTNLFDTVYRAAKRNAQTADCTRKDVERSVAKWLIGGRDRDGCRSKRTKSGPATNTE